MSRRTVVSLFFVACLAASTTAPQVGEETRAVRVASLAGPAAPPTAVRAEPSAPEREQANAAHSAGDAAVSARRAQVWLPEPPAWMIWLSGIAVAALIAVRRSRRGGL